MKLINMAYLLTNPSLMCSTRASRRVLGSRLGDEVPRGLVSRSDTTVWATWKSYIMKNNLSCVEKFKIECKNLDFLWRNFFFCGFKRAGQQVRHHSLGNLIIIHHICLCGKKIQSCGVISDWMQKLKKEIEERIVFFGGSKRAGQQVRHHSLGDL